MTFRAHASGPCFEIVDVETGEPPEADGGDGWAHYATRLEAARELARRLVDDWTDPGDPWVDPPRRLAIRSSFATPCVGLFCDGACGEVADLSDEGWTHLDPDNPLPIALEDFDWTEINGRHYCPECAPPICDDCDELHMPNDCPQSGRLRPVPVHVDQMEIPL